MAHDQPEPTFLVLWEDGSRTFMTASDIGEISTVPLAWWGFLCMAFGVKPSAKMPIRRASGKVEYCKVLLPDSVPHDATFHTVP